MNELALLARADLAARMLEDAGHGLLRRNWQVEASFKGRARAYIVRRANGERWLVLPGTGHADVGERPSWLVDWARNLASAVGMVWDFGVSVPVKGASGKYRWGRSPLRAANDLHDWLLARGERIDAVAGHSKGGQVGQILAWSRWWRYADDDPRHIPECHVIGAARPCFTAGCPSAPTVHVWNARDDLVGRLPLHGWHVGILHDLPELPAASVVTAHHVTGYRKRLVMRRMDLMAGAKEPASP